MNRKITLLLLLVILTLSSCYRESKLLVNADFRATIEGNNHTAPVKITLENNSTGADFYQWIFEGGEPASSTDKTPASVTYKQAGSYTIVLEAWNDHERGRKEFTFSVDSTVVVSFDAEVLINDFAPAHIKITNHTQGASAFLWTFEDGEPATSTEQHPGNVFFREAGEHSLLLTVNNGRETFTSSKKIFLTTPLSVAFDIEPSFDDFDYEVPFSAALVNKTVSGLTYEWTATGGIIDNKNAENAVISMTTPGNYTITLKGENRKETQTVSKTLTLKSNSNLYTVKDVKFGVKQAASSVGSFYSLKYRAVIPQNEVSESNGKDIDLAFYGINASFEKCYFVSPDLAQNAGFYAIPHASSTYFVNTPETSGLNFSSSAFDAMTDDSPLQTLDIRAESNTNTWFIANPVPRVVLFETADGRKGVIKVKAFVSEQIQSYVLTDIKFQKEKRQ